MPPTTKSTSQTLPQRRLGYAALRDIEPHLIKTLDTYNLDIHKIKDSDSYFVFSKTAGKNPRNIMPSIIDVQRNVKHGALLDLTNTKKLLEFLHQPIRCAVSSAVESEKNDDITLAFDNVARGLWPMQELGEKLKENLKDIHALEHRQSVQSALRFLTTGSVDIPVVRSKKQEDHTNRQDKMRDEKAWKFNMETGHSESSVLFDTQNPPADKVKTIPGLTFDAEKDSYTLAIHPTLLNQGALEHPNQRALRKTLFDILNTVRISPIHVSDKPETAQEVRLSTNDLVSLCARIHHTKNIGDELIPKVAHEEKESARQKRTRDTVQQLTDDKKFQVLVDKTTFGDKPETILKHIAKSTTALTSVIQSEHISRTWTTRFPSRKDDMPFESTIADYVSMNSAINTLLDQDKITQEDMQAFAREYNKLLSFTDLAAESLMTAAENQNTKSIASRLLDIGLSAGSAGLAYSFTQTGLTDLSPAIYVAAYGFTTRGTVKTLDHMLDATLPSRRDQNHALRQDISTKMHDLRNTVNNPSVINMRVSEDFLDEHLQDTLSVLRSDLKQNGSFSRQLIQSGAEGVKEFVHDIWDMLKESRIAQATAVGIGAYVVDSTNGGNMSGFINDMVSGPEPDIPAGLEGLADVMPDDSIMNNTPVQDFSENEYSKCHMDLGMYKHCVFSSAVLDPASGAITGLNAVFQNIVIDPINQALNSVDMGPIGNKDSAVIQAAIDILGPGGEVVFDGNVVQNATHGPLWVYSFGAGLDSGMRLCNTDPYQSPISHSLSFLNEPADLLRSGAHSSLSTVSAILNRVGMKPSFLPEPKKSIHDRLYALTQSGKAFDTIDPMHIRAPMLDHENGEKDNLGHLALKIAGFKNKLDITNHDIQEMHYALDKLDIKLSHMSHDYGVYNHWHKNMALEDIEPIRQSLNNFEKTKDLKSFKKEISAPLQRICGFEMRQSDESEVFNALVKPPMDERTGNVLRRESNIAYGRHHRAAKRAEHTSHFIEAQHIGQRVGALSNLFGNYIAETLVTTGRTAQRTYDFTAHRPALSIGIKGTAAIIAGAEMVGVLPEELTGAAKAIGTGIGLSALGTSAVAFNTAEDVFIVHTAAMTTCASAGKLSGALANGVIRPTIGSAFELSQKLRSMFSEGSQTITMEDIQSWQDEGKNIYFVDEDHKICPLFDDLSIMQSTEKNHNNLSI